MKNATSENFACFCFMKNEARSYHQKMKYSSVDFRRRTSSVVHTLSTIINRINVEITFNYDIHDINKACRINSFSGLHTGRCERTLESEHVTFQREG
jgi:hypothetical protein